jgi:hypothetical protein
MFDREPPSNSGNDMNLQKKKTAARPILKLNDLKAKKDPKGGGREISVTEPPEPTYTTPATRKVGTT